MNKDSFKKLKAQLKDVSTQLERCSSEKEKYASLQTRIAKGEHKALLDRMSALDMQRIISPSKELDKEIAELERELSVYRETPDEIQRKVTMLADLFKELSGKRDQLHREITLAYAESFKTELEAPNTEALLDYVAQRLYSAHKRGQVSTSNLDYILTFGLFGHRPDSGVHPAKTLEARWKALDEKVEQELMA